MGLSNSRFKQQTHNNQESHDPLKYFNTAPPAAAVVGAGIAGVHVAYELAQMGFNVTVFEEKDRVACGETASTLPFVGVGLLEPSLARTCMRREIIKSALFPSSCSSIIACDSVLHSIFSPLLWRWLFARTRNSFTEEEVMLYTNNLSRLSLSVVQELARKHASLSSHILAEAVTVTSRNSGGGSDSPAKPAASSPIMLDPVGWTHVKFAFNSRVEPLQMSLHYDMESVRSILVTDLSTAKEKTEAPPQHQHSFDVVVLAAGAGTGSLTLNASRLPIVGLTGWTAHIQNPSGQLLGALRSLFPSLNSSDEHSVAQQPDLVQLSGKCSLYGYNYPPTRGSDQHALFNLSGLLSMDTTYKQQPAAQKQLERLEAYTSVMCDVDLPLVETYGNKDASDNNNTTSAALEVSEYVRAFSPDAVPIVDHVGGSFNTFVCAGFGDHAADLAPGAAKVLCKLVHQQAEVLLVEEAAANGSVATQGLVPHGSVPLSRLEAVESEMQLLLNGILPSPQDAAGEMIVKGGAEEDGSLPLRFSGNPFATNRFKGLIKKQVKDVNHYSLSSYLEVIESAVIAATDPFVRSMKSKLVTLVSQDGVPLALRDGVVSWLYEVEDDLVLQEELRAIAQSKREMLEKMEDPAGRSASWVEESKQEETEKLKRFREM